MLVILLQKILPILIGVLSLVPASPTPAFAQSTRCDRTLQSVKASLPSVHKFRVETISRSFGQPPKGRTQSLTVIMEGNDAEKLMNDDPKLSTIAKKAIGNCPRLGLVLFWIKETDWGMAYGLRNGKVQQFTCKDTDQKLRWGETYCP